jgi:hypothetical protein
MHTPAEQALPAAQMLPQVPQLFGSVATLVQAPPHTVVYGPQEQTPPVADEQVEPVGQLTAQVTHRVVS